MFYFVLVSAADDTRPHERVFVLMLLWTNTFEHVNITESKLRSPLNEENHDLGTLLHTILHL